MKVITNTHDADAIDALYCKTYRSFIEEIDGHDNGIESFRGGERNYEVNTTLSHKVGRLNTLRGKTVADANARFAYALREAGTEFAVVVQDYLCNWWPARAAIVAAVEGASEVHASKEIVVLESNIAYDSHLYEVEKERDVAGVTKYVLYPEPTGEWRIKAVAEKEGSFAQRLKLPKAWLGLKGDVLIAQAGIPGCVFVHAGGFIGANTTKEGAMQMAFAALSSDNGDGVGCAAVAGA